MSSAQANSDDNFAGETDWSTAVLLCTAMRQDTGHMIFQKIEGRPGYSEAAKKTFEVDKKTGERTDYKYEPLGKIYRVLRKDENAQAFSESFQILDPDDFCFKTLVRVD